MSRLRSTMFLRKTRPRSLVDLMSAAYRLRARASQIVALAMRWAPLEAWTAKSGRVCWVSHWIEPSRLL